MSFADARLKIERADKHISDIKLRISLLPDSYIATVEINPHGGNEVIKYVLGDTNIASDLALMIGDAVHNLKSALDYAWLRTIEGLVPSAVGKFAKFPVYPNRDALEKALRGRKIDVSNPSLFNLMVSHIKSYEGGNGAIWSIHKLNILDKHRLLIPLVSRAGIDGIEAENEQGRPENISSWDTTQATTFYFPLPVGFHTKNKGKVAIAVTFDKGTSVDAMNVSDTLSGFSKVAFNVVQLLEKLFTGTLTVGA